MENWIEQICEPQRLFLAWQGPDLNGERYRWAVASIEPRGRDCDLRYFPPGAEFDYFNPRHSFEELTGLGYQGYPGFTPKRELYQDGVLPALMRRLPPRTRPDFTEYARQFRLKAGSSLSDLSLLGYTEAKLPSDGFSLVDPLSPDAESCDLMLEIAGYRRYKTGEPLQLGLPVEIAPESDNKFDPNAVTFSVGTRKIGYVNRLQAPTFLRWISRRRITGCVERLNGKSDHPRAFIFVRVRPVEARVAA